MTKCAVIGAGAWGTALADILARNGNDVRIWAYEWDVVESINRAHQNRRFLSGCVLHDNIQAFNDLGEALKGAELVTFATLRMCCALLQKTQRVTLPREVPVVIASKGIERDPLALMTNGATEKIPQARWLSLSGQTSPPNPCPQPMSFLSPTQT